MYAFGRRVFVKPLGSVGEVIERSYAGRRVAYVVRFPDGSDVMVGSAALSPVDYVCDGCGKPRRGRPAAREDVWVCGELDDSFGFCFPCVKAGERDASLNMES